MAEHWLQKFAKWVSQEPGVQAAPSRRNAAPKGVIHPLKTPVEAGPYKVSVEDICGPYLAPDQYKSPSAPEPTTHLFSAEVLIVNISPKNEARNYGYDKFRLYDEKGYVFDALDTGKQQRKQPVLSNGVLSLGLWVRGWVTWEIPIQIVPHRIQFFSGYLAEASVDFLVKV